MYKVRALLDWKFSVMFVIFLIHFFWYLHEYVKMVSYRVACLMGHTLDQSFSPAQYLEVMWQYCSLLKIISTSGFQCSLRWTISIFLSFFNNIKVAFLLNSCWVSNCCVKTTLAQCRDHLMSACINHLYTESV